jgi:hypothetical protein
VCVFSVLVSSSPVLAAETLSVWCVSQAAGVAGGQGVRRGQEGGRSTLIIRVEQSGGEVMGASLACACTHTCVALRVVVAYGMAPLPPLWHAGGRPHARARHGTTVAVADHETRT